MLALPRTIHLTRGSSEGRTSLNAFDNALGEAGIENLNLLRASSIVPRDAAFVDTMRPLPVGTVVPAVYAKITSTIPGELVSACIGAGIGAAGGVLMEYTHTGPADDAEAVIRSMIEEAFGRRNWTLDRILYATSEHKVDRLGCAVAAALLLDGVPVEGR